MQSTETATPDSFSDDAKSDNKIEDSLLRSVSWLCNRYGLGRTDEALIAGLPRAPLLTPSLAIEALKNAGITGGLVQRNPHELPLQLTPLILLRRQAGACILLSRHTCKTDVGKIDYRYQVILPELSKEAVEIGHDELLGWYAGYAILAKPTAQAETDYADELPEKRGHWLFSTLWRYRRYYRSAALAAVLANVLTLATVFFTMNVYDRVIPNQAFITLWSLAAGVTVAMIFEAITRYVRAHLIDVAGKKADLVLGSMLFRQALDVRMEHKPASTGAFASQIREFESVRDFIASASLAALSDLPFTLLFIGVIFVTGGTLGWIPLLMIPLIVLVSAIIQWPLARAMKENLQESSQKQGVLIESIEGLEVLKSMRGDAWMQRRWQHYSALQSATGLKTRHYSSLATGAVTLLQQLQTVFLVVAGVYLIDAGTLTMGALIATVMLSGRATAPLGQVVGLAIRYQQAKSALVSLNKLMDMPVDRDISQNYVALPDLRGDVSLKKVSFAYPAPPMRPNPQVLNNVSLEVAAGERIAILGRIGSGKSTLLRLIARLYSPVSGQLFSAGLDVNQIDPADWRRAISFVGQNARLFSGTLRDNIMAACPEATQNEFLRVLQLTGLDQIAARHPAGINMPVGEGGDALSGGQRQLVSLARSLLGRPKMLLLDEPTSAMDTQSEQLFLSRLSGALEGQTLIVVTHRPSLLRFVDRIVVVEDGKIVADGPKDTVLRMLGGQEKTQAANAPQRESEQEAAS
ncbi:type I secretion system permease/ATPase [Enterobacter cloacae]|uniref:type I secretion system permease/ATPase n=1 Tax=Enterobacter cloacae TaxID=550 RepID=UPI001E5F2453|nr:type I secretion system permease/ATPase [Enterobacter cloacae]MCE1972557.1 type I secretion system permease/ATPase [Enterobacter cloacae]